MTQTALCLHCSQYIDRDTLRVSMSAKSSGSHSCSGYEVHPSLSLPVHALRDQ
jgi:hypothetical protein